MKIIVDKVVGGLPHAICRADVRLVLSSVPDTWVEDIEIVRLSASRASRVALINRSDKALTISSRGIPKKQTLREMIAELAAHALGFKTRTFQHLQARHAPTLESLVEPLVEELSARLSRCKVTLVR